MLQLGQPPLMCLNARPSTDVPPFSGVTAKMQAGQPSLSFDMKASSRASTASYVIGKPIIDSKWSTSVDSMVFGDECRVWA